MDPSLAGFALFHRVMERTMAEVAVSRFSVEAVEQLRTQWRDRILRHGLSGHDLNPHDPSSGLSLRTQLWAEAAAHVAAGTDRIYAHPTAIARSGRQGLIASLPAYGPSQQHSAAGPAASSSSSSSSSSSAGMPYPAVASFDLAALGDDAAMPALEAASDTQQPPAARARFAGAGVGGDGDGDADVQLPAPPQPATVSSAMAAAEAHLSAHPQEALDAWGDREVLDADDDDVLAAQSALPSGAKERGRPAQTGVCVFTEVKRRKTTKQRWGRWTARLEAGVVRVGHHDLFFHRADGTFDW